MNHLLTSSIVLSMSFVANAAFADGSTVSSKPAKPKIVASVTLEKAEAPKKPEETQSETAPKPASDEAPKKVEETVHVPIESDTRSTELHEVEVRSKALFMSDQTKLVCKLPCTEDLKVGKTYIVSGGVSPYEFTVTKNTRTLRVEGDSKTMKNIGLALLVGAGALSTVAGGIATHASSSMDQAKRDYDAGKISLQDWKSELDSAGGTLDLALGVLTAAGASLIAGIIVYAVAPGTKVRINGTSKAGMVRPLSNGFTF
jgi:hypothetical protein